MKITIDEDAVRPSDDEIEEAADTAKEITPETQGEFNKQSEGVQEIIIPRYVVDDIEAMGMTVDDFVAMFLKETGKVQ